MGNRIGQNARIVAFFETAFGQDTGITVGYVWPTAGQSSAGDTAPPIEVQTSDGSALPYDSIPGLIQFGGAVPTKFDYEFQPRMDKVFFGESGYVGPDVSMPPDHEFTIPVSFGDYAPGSLQLQDEFGESPAVYNRGRGIRIADRSLQANITGYCQQSYTLLGAGNMVQANLGGSRVLTPDGATSYNDGRIYETRGGVTRVLANLTAFELREINNAKREESFFNDGIAGDVNCGNINVQLKVGLAMQRGGATLSADLVAYLAAVNRELIRFDWIQANAPLSRCTKWVRHQLTTITLARMAPKPGGIEGIKYDLQGRLERASANALVAAEIIATNRGPFNINGTNDHLSVILDGGAPLVTTLTHGGAVPLSQVLTDVNATLGVNATGDDFFGTGFFRITHGTPGLHDVQVAGTAAAALFGFDSATHPGRDNCPYRKTIRNATATAL